jgi:hypothetical protein
MGFVACPNCGCFVTQSGEAPRGNAKLYEPSEIPDKKELIHA